MYLARPTEDLGINSVLVYLLSFYFWWISIDRKILFFLPALLMRMSTFSSVAKIPEAHSLTEAREPRSSFRNSALPLILPSSVVSVGSAASATSWVSSRTVSSPLRSFLARIRILAPRCIRSRAVSFPMPAVAPVITIVWKENNNVLGWGRRSARRENITLGRGRTILQFRMQFFCIKCKKSY